MSNILLSVAAFTIFGILAACSPAISTVSDELPAIPVATPAPQAKDAPIKSEQTAVFAGGCFWGIEAVFEHVKGVINVRSGYSGGEKDTADYESVSEGNTGHAESVEVTFDPAQVTYQQLLYVFFTVAHDPTSLNFQGPDHGTQYRSVIFFADKDQQRTAESFIDALNRSKAYRRPIATEVAPLKAFYEAESYHQDYMKHHPDDPYIVINDAPKVAALKKKFPDLYKD